jgi:hypothetical protein
MCTSLAPGFYLRDKESFIHWRDQILALKQRYGQDCIFSVFDKKPDFGGGRHSNISGSSEGSFNIVGTTPQRDKKKKINHSPESSEFEDLGVDMDFPEPMIGEESK